MQKQNIIAVIDNDSKFVKDFKKVLLDDFKSEYEVEFLQLDDKAELDKVLEGLNSIKNKLKSIFIDLVLFEYEDASNLLKGLEVVKEIRIIYPNIPIFIITKYLSDNAEYFPLITWASLEDVDGILIKHYLMKNPKFVELIPFDYSDLNTIIEKAAYKRSCYNSNKLVYINTNLEEYYQDKIKETFNPDLKAFMQIKQIGFTAFFYIVENLFIVDKKSNKIVIEYFRAGYSGSFMFKIRIFSGEDEKIWLIKIDSTDKIKKEFENYKKLEGNLQSINFPRYIENIITYNNLSGFAIELKTDAITLFDYLINNKFNGRKILVKIENTLENFYSLFPKDFDPVRLWSSIYSLNSETIILVSVFFKDYTNLIKKFINEEDFDKVKNFFDTNGTIYGINEKTFKITKGFVHKDLNLKNILIEKSNDNIVIIDVAKSEINHLCLDIAKMEVDSIFYLMDSKEKEFFDWKSLKNWEYLLNLVLKNDILYIPKRKSKYSNINFIFNFIISLRKMLLGKLYPQIVNKEYYCALLNYSFKYLTYQDISIQKKILLIKYISKLIDLIKTK